MILFYLSSFIIYLLPVSRGHLVIQDEDYSLLPPVYQMNDYQNCNTHKNIYCKAHIRLKPLNGNSTIWKLIKATRKDKFLYNHNEISRTVCVPRVYENSPRDLEKFIVNAVNRQVEQVNLTSTVENVSCKKYSYLTNVDYFVLDFIIGYLFLIIAATVYDLILRKSKDSVKDNILTAFSLRRNYGHIFNVNKSSHYQQLKCIQGIRVFICTFVIWSHTMLSFTFTFLENTIYIEEMFYKILHVYVTFNMLLTQTFSLVSAWLLTVQVLGIFEANKEFTAKDCFLIFINRCCRMWPALIAFVITYRRAILDFLAYNPLSEVAEDTAANCNEYWIYTLLFIQNFFTGDTGCNAGFWFISADVQLYAISLVVLYLILKFGCVKKLLALFFLISYGLFGIIIYVNNLDIAYRLNPESCRWRNFSKDQNFVYLYAMPHVNIATYLVGISFGILYYNNRQREIVNKKMFDSIWIPSFFAFPALVVGLTSYEFSGISAALIGPLLKPLYCFGIGMGILGMSQSKTGIIKKMFEWRPIEFLSQFTYSVYINHFVIVFYRTAMSKPLKISNYILITAAITDAFFGFLIGFVMYLLVELPWINIQKVYLPQVKKTPIKNE